MPPQEVAEVAVREADTCSQSRFFQYPVQCPLHGGFGALPRAARCGVEVFGAVAVHRLGQRGHVFFGGFADVPAVSSHARGYLPSYGLLGGGVYFVEEAVEAVSVEVAQRFVADALVQHGACHVGFRGVVEGVYVHFPGSDVVPSFGALHTCADGGIGVCDTGGGGVYDYFFAQGCGGGFCGAADACALLRGLRRPAGGVGVLFFEELVELLLQLPALLRVSGGVEARPRVADSEAQDRGCGAGFARSRGGPRAPLLDFGGLPAEAQAAVGRLPADDVGALPFVARLVGSDGDAAAFELPYQLRRRPFGDYRQAHFPEAHGTPRLRFEVARGHFLYVGHDAGYLFRHRARHVGIDPFQMAVNAVGAV